MATCTSSQEVVQHLNELFGAILNFDVIKNVAVSCEYDIHESSNQLLEISRHPNEANLGKASPQLMPISKPKSKKTLDFEKAVAQINKGYKVLVLIRGMPGSGKSYLARKILESTVGFDVNHPLHILSTDDYFYQLRGEYDYDVRKLNEAHNWNQSRAFQGMSRGFSPIVIDNTNTEMWEMKPYATMATDYGYLIEILEPYTHWSFNDRELAKRNHHGVPRVKIKEMIDRYEKNIIPEKLLSAYNLVYKLQRPPQMRLYPPPDINTMTLETTTKNVNCVPKSKSVSVLNSGSTDSNTKPIETINLMEFDEDIPKAKSHSISMLETKSSCWNDNPIDEILTNTRDNASTTNILQPYQQSTMEITVISSDEENDSPKPHTKNVTDIEEMWGISEDLLKSWNIVTPLEDNSNVWNNPQEVVRVLKVITIDVGCNTEEEYFRLLRNDKLIKHYEELTVLETLNRDINRHTPIRTMSISKKPTLDKSCMTDDIYEDFENHISQLTTLFPTVPLTHLSYWYNKCKGDLEWTIEFLLEAKEEVTSLIVDDINSMKVDAEKINQSPETDSDSSNNGSEHKIKKRSKRNQRLSTDNDHLKKFIESKIDISGEHYSEKLLKVKNYKFGKPSRVDAVLSEDKIDMPPNSSEPSTSKEEIKKDSLDDYVILLDSDMEFDELTNSDLLDGSEIQDETIELNIGEHFVSQLESHFGDPNLEYPKGFQPVVQVPLSLARQLYTFYIESVYQQMDNQKQILETLTREDEEFARKLQAKEKEKSEATKPTPDLKKIMDDQQAAKTVFQKETEKWKNLNPDNLAAKLTRQKLFSTFPTIAQDTLVEILHAHDNKYGDTVETLLASTGTENIRDNLEMLKEPPIKNEVIQEMKDAQKNYCSEEYEELHEATFYRAEASKYLKRRTDLYEKAQQYHQRGMTEVAQFYSGLASLQTSYFERANGMAAMAFLDEHSKRLQNFNTLDLHFLFVKEALPALDVFLDRNIHLLRVSKTKQSEYLQIITGRGNRSENGISKIRPAVQQRLRTRNIHFAVLNPGLLKIKVTKTTLVTSELSRS